MKKLFVIVQPPTQMVNRNRVFRRNSVSLASAFQNRVLERDAGEVGKLLQLFFLIISLLFVTCECGKQNPVINAEAASIAELNQAGWTKFSAEDYEGAAICFNAVLARDSVNISANLGKGWSLLMQNSNKLPEIVSCLQKGIHYDTWKSDANCGLAVTRLIQKQYVEVITLVDRVLADCPDYFFQYKPSIDWHDLILLKAQAYFFSKKYSLAWETVQQLTSVFTIDPDVPGSWVVNGALYFSFEAALSKIIELLSDIYKK